MELKLSLAPSRISSCLNALLLIAATGAIAISGLHFGWKLLLGFLIWGLSVIRQRRDDAVEMLVLKARSRSQPDLEDISDNVDYVLSGTVHLKSARYLEVRLQSAWCLSWIQILSLKSHDRTRALVILPDSCDTASRRQLRKLIITRTC